MVFRRAKPRSDPPEDPKAAYEEAPGMWVFPPGVTVPQELPPTRLPDKPAPGRGSLDPDPTVTRYSSRYKTEITYRHVS